MENVFISDSRRIQLWPADVRADAISSLINESIIIFEISLNVGVFLGFIIWYALEIAEYSTIILSSILVFAQF